MSSAATAMKTSTSTAASDETVQGNYIGTDVTGSLAVSTTTPAGIYFESGSGNSIGGSVAGAGNVISGNALAGVEFTGAGTTDNLVQGNLIGTNAAGTAAVPNGTRCRNQLGCHRQHDRWLDHDSRHRCRQLDQR